MLSAAQPAAGALPIQGGSVRKIPNSDRAPIGYVRKCAAVWWILNCGEGRWTVYSGPTVLAELRDLCQTLPWNLSTKELRDSRTCPVRDEPASTEDIKASSLHGFFPSSIQLISHILSYLPSNPFNIYQPPQ